MYSSNPRKDKRTVASTKTLIIAICILLGLGIMVAIFLPRGSGPMIFTVPAETTSTAMPTKIQTIGTPTKADVKGVEFEGMLLPGVCHQIIYNQGRQLFCNNSNLQPGQVLLQQVGGYNFELLPGLPNNEFGFTYLASAKTFGNIEVWRATEFWPTTHPENFGHDLETAWGYVEVTLSQDQVSMKLVPIGSFHSIHYEILDATNNPTACFGELVQVASCSLSQVPQQVLVLGDRVVPLSGFQTDNVYVHWVEMPPK